ncbi:hypothetical protein HMPREF3293_01770 [Christensenella minuta]|uniref:Uncharacterized protein n=1 Tax=Christensenella minuta TaxID=626937 RepID=A0A136Q4T6_9FIRM|nr:hypothetical protein HMPREF3293_01770 [Christensenella minuta]
MIKIWTGQCPGGKIPEESGGLQTGRRNRPHGKGAGTDKAPAPCKMPCLRHRRISRQLLNRENGIECGQGLNRP